MSVVPAVAVALAGMLGVGCVSGNDKPATGQGRSAPQVPGAAGPTGAVPVNASPDLDSMTQAALADAARRAGVDASALRVVSAERVTWPDGSLGCPTPGRMYTMALVPGYRIRIQAGAEVMDYHASLRGPPALCPAGRARTAPPGSHI